MAKKPSFFGDTMKSSKKAEPIMDIGVVIAVKPSTKGKKTSLKAPAKLVAPPRVISKSKKGLL